MSRTLPCKSNTRQSSIIPVPELPEFCVSVFVQRL